jgi:hypothetical protein
MNYVWYQNQQMHIGVWNSIIHTVYRLHVSATHVIIFREMHYKRQKHRNIAAGLEPTHIYKKINTKNNTWFQIHITDKNTDKTICDWL